MCIETQSINSFILPTGSYDANQELKSTSIISQNSNVEFNSPNNIIMDTGFETIQGAIFEAIINPCNN